MTRLAAVALFLGGCAGAPPPAPPPLSLQEEGIRELTAVADYLRTAPSLNAFLSYGNPEQGLTPARFVVGPGERVRVSISSVQQADAVLLVSNGQDAYYRLKDLVWRAPMPRGFNDELSKFVSIVGILTGTTIVAQRLQAPGSSSTMTFERLLKEVRIERIEPGMIVYRLPLIHATYRLSYERDSHRPLRRSMTFTHSAATPSGPTEIWETVLVDQPLEDVEFTLPP